MLEPLMLRPGMRLRLRAAVRALLALPGLAGASDPVRLAAVVLLSRMPEESRGEASEASRVVVIRKRELGRWLGLSEDRMKAVLRELRAGGEVSAETLTDDQEASQALEFRIGALAAGRHPLDLTKKELTVLHGLVEALFAPGWVHRDGRVTPGGPLAGRTGRGAATDRLAALLLVLEADGRGRVRLCGGRLDTGAGRPAVTLARLLGCTPAGAAAVLGRLEEAGVVERPRRGASGLRSRSRIVLPAVAAAHRVQAATDGPAPVRRERVRRHELSFAGSLDDATPHSEAAVTAVTLQVGGVEEGFGAAVADLDGATPLHSWHSPVVAQAGDAQVVVGFSGEAAVVAEHRRPERADAREEHSRPAEGVRAGEAAAVVGGQGGPLRGDQPNPLLDLDQQQQHRRTVRGRTRAPKPVPADLVLVLAPVECLWERLDRAWSRRRITVAARTELARVAMWTGPEDAPAVLADRLRARLEVQGGSALITDPVGWLLAKGLPQRAECAHPACDSGTRLDTGTDCVTCEKRILDRRSTRALLAAEAAADLPAAVTAAQRRAAIDDQLRRHAALRAERQAAADRRAEQEREEAEARLAARQALAEAEEAARQTLPCEDCGTERAAGLCAPCWALRSTRDTIRTCVNFMLAGAADLTDRADVTAVADRIRGELRTRMLRARPAGADRDDVLASDLLTVQGAVAGYRADALVLLARSPLADAEAELAHDAAMRSAHRHPTPAAAVAAADRAAEKARTRAAEHLLAQRLATVEALRARSAAPTG
ncbi:hypothetical protein ACWEO1_20480 [Kitasatospora cineracea]